MLKIKLKNLFILLKCYLYFISHGKANKKPIEIKKILVVQTAKLGDMVCTTPVFRAVKEKYPEVEVFVLGSAINKELLTGNNDVNQYLIKTGSFSTMKKIIKYEKFDFTCIITPNFENLALCYLAGVPLIAAPKVVNGYSPYETKLYKILRSLVKTVPHQFGNYVPREYLRLLEPVQISSQNTKKHLAFSSAAAEKISDLLKKNNIDYQQDFIVGISPVVANQVKLWPAERFAQIADYLVNQYQIKVILIGGPDDTAKVAEVRASANLEHLDLSGKLNIDELKALIAKLKLFISVDTGPIYIAEAFDVPTIDILGPMAAGEQPPIGLKHKIVELSGREPQLHIMNARVYDKSEAERQIQEISTDLVIKKVDELIKELYG